jgi:glycosyltransferase involved in cell wall biosynthesis
MAIVVAYSTDSSVKLALEKGNFDQLKREVECYSAIDDVWLVTQDDVDYSHLFNHVLHFPCGIHILPPLNWLIYSVRAFLTMYKRVNNVSAIRAYGVGCLYTALLSTVCKVPLIVSYEYDWSDQLFLIGRRIIGCISRVVETFMFSSADVVVGLSQRLCEKAGRRGARGVIWIPNGVDMNSIPSFAFQEKQRLKAELAFSDQRIVLYVGRLHRIKRVADLIQAVGILRRKGVDVALLVVGDGEERSKLVKLVRVMGLESQVLFVGAVSHDQVFRFMTIADVIVLPSIMEGNPRVLIEAMFCKLAITATDVVGINDLIVSGENGLLVKPFSPGELSAAIGLLISNQDISRKLVDQAYRKACEDFDQEKLLKKNVDLISSIMRKTI